MNEINVSILTDIERSIFNSILQLDTKINEFLKRKDDIVKQKNEYIDNVLLKDHSYVSIEQIDEEIERLIQLKKEIDKSVSNNSFISELRTKEGYLDTDIERLTQEQFMKIYNFSNMSNIPFEFRFKIWYDYCKNKLEIPFTPSKDKYPNIYLYFMENKATKLRKQIVTIDDIIKYIKENKKSLNINKNCEDFNIKTCVIEHGYDPEILVKKEAMETNTWSFFVL